MIERTFETATYSRYFIIIDRHEVGSLMVSMVSVAVFESIVLCPHFCLGY